MTRSRSGTVYLVGAGPGDPGLLTVRGKELLCVADVVVYDYLSDNSLLTYCRSDVRLIDVGKRPDRPVPQDEINEVLITSARSAEVVVRLKGGDPFVFGRGGEEALALAEEGIAFEVVPGISSAIAVPAYAGIPVTHRGLSTSFTVVTGHRHGNATDQVDWEALARLGGTIVVLMGVAHRSEIAEKLIRGGLNPTTAVAAIRWGTRGDQSTFRTTLSQLGEAQISSPSTIVIGEVAALDLTWYEKKPLLGKRVVVTRAKEQTPKLANLLKDLGATVLSVPTIEICGPLDNYASLISSARDIKSYEWVIFSSANSVAPFFNALRDVRDLSSVKVAAIGKGTAKEIAKFNVIADFVPSAFVAETFASEFPLGEGRILIPQADIARDVIASELRAKGWLVDTVVAYRNKVPTINPELAQEIASSDAVTFTSRSTVKNFASVYSIEILPKVIVAIGPITFEALEETGVAGVAVASTHDLDGLVDTLVNLLTKQRVS